MRRARHLLQRQLVLSSIDVEYVPLVDCVLVAPLSSNELDCRHVEDECKNVLGYLFKSSNPFYISINLRALTLIVI